MRNLIQLSRRRGGVISNLLLRLHPSSSSSSSSLSSTFASKSHPRSHHLHQILKPSPFINPNSSSTSTSTPTSTLPIHGTTTSSLCLKSLRFYSTEPKSSNPNFKHQEIEGPTVERDLSPLANETRQVSLRLMKTMYDVSRLLAVIGISQLALGAWISLSTSSPAIMAMSVVAFALPFSMAFMLRQSLKHMHFFNKMEQIGRLQILTSTMQISKHINLFFNRLKVVGYLCLAGLPLPFIFSLLSSSSSSPSSS